MNPLRRYEVYVDADVEIRDERVAESDEQAAAHTHGAVEQAIKEALRRELSGGESSVNVTVVDVRDVTDQQ